MKIGFVSSLGGASVRKFVERAEQMSIEAGVVALREMEMRCDLGECRLAFGRKPLDWYDALLVRGIGWCLREFEVLMEYCETSGIRVVDKGLKKVKVNSGTKSLTALRLLRAGLAYPNTVFLEGGRLGETKNHFGWPCVVKPVVGKAGQDVFKVETKEGLRQLARKVEGLWMLQEWIPNDGDYRVMVLGNRALGAMRRRSRDPNEFRHNVSLGAEAVQVELPGEVLKVAVEATKACGWEFAGVDLLRHKETGKWYVNEVNRAPQFEGFVRSTGIDVTGEVIKYLLEKEYE